MSDKEPPVFSHEKEKILELEVRRRIYDIVKEYAGSHFREIERKSWLSTGSVRYHLDYLVKRGLIIEVREGNNLRYFPKEFKTENTTLLALLRQGRVRQIILFILTHESCSQEEIAEAAGISPSALTWHLKKLEKASIIDTIRSGRENSYKILTNPEEIIALLITYRESFLDSLVDKVIDMWDVD